jgi:hypothetical protein
MSSIRLELTWLVYHPLAVKYFLEKVGQGLRKLTFNHHFNLLLYTHHRIAADWARHCSQLQRVDVTGDAFSSELCELFEQCAGSITELRVDTMHTASFAHNVALLRNLTALFVLRGVSYQSLPRLNNVQEFVLPSAYAGKCQLPLCGASCRVLVLHDARRFTPEFNLRGFLQRCQALDTLSLGRVAQLDELLDELQQGQRPWKALRLTDSSGSSVEVALVSFLQSCGSRLLHLDLAANFTDSLLAAIARHCPNLVGLSLLGEFSPSPSTHAQLQRLFHSCPCLRELCLAHVPLSDAQLQDLGAHCPRLECLGLLLRAGGLTAAGLHAALRQFPHLQEVLLPGVVQRETAPAALRDVLDAWARAGSEKVYSAAARVPVLPFWRRWVGNLN